MKNVYLAGPITHLTFNDATSWRDVAFSYLKIQGINAVSPLRAKEYLANKGTLSATCGKESKHSILSHPKSVLIRDFYDVTHCDLVFVNLIGATKISIGTMMEIAWAYQKKTPVVCCMEPGNVHEHAFVNEAIDFRVHTLDAGLDLCKHILGAYCDDSNS